MKATFLIILAAALLSSCCVFSSQDCGCKPSEPFLAEATKDWIAPLESEELLFLSQDIAAREQTIARNYSADYECVGGDECCTNYPIHTTEFITNTNGKKLVILYAKAIMNDVQFMSDPDNNSNVYLTNLDVTTGVFRKTDNTIDVTETDTLVNGLKTSKLIFRVNPVNNTILFNRLEFVKGMGITAYTDLNGTIWKRK